PRRCSNLGSAGRPENLQITRRRRARDARTVPSSSALFRPESVGRAHVYHLELGRHRRSQMRCGFAQVEAASWLESDAASKFDRGRSIWPDRAEIQVRTESRSGSWPIANEAKRSGMMVARGLLPFAIAKSAASKAPPEKFRAQRRFHRLAQRE